MRSLRAAPLHKLATDGAAAVTISAVLRYTHRRKRGLTPSINERGTYEKDSFSAGRSGAHFDFVTIRVSENSSGQFGRRGRPERGFRPEIRSATPTLGGHQPVHEERERVARDLERIRL